MVYTHYHIKHFVKGNLVGCWVENTMSFVNSSYAEEWVVGINKNYQKGKLNYFVTEPFKAQVSREKLNSMGCLTVRKQFRKELEKLETKVSKSLVTNLQKLVDRHNKKGLCKYGSQFDHYLSNDLISILQYDFFRYSEFLTENQITKALEMQTKAANQLGCELTCTILWDLAYLSQFVYSF